MTFISDMLTFSNFLYVVITCNITCTCKWLLGAWIILGLDEKKGSLSYAHKHMSHGKFGHLVSRMFIKLGAKSL